MWSEIGEFLFMKTANKISLVAACAALALVGTGYAAWTFSKDASTASVGNVNITAKADEVGELTVNNENFYLVIDQKFLGWATTATATASDLSKVTLTYTGAASGTAATNTDWLIDEDIKFICTFDGSALSNYIVFGNADEYTKTVDYTGTAITCDYTLPTVSWKDGMKPDNETEYDAMVTAIGTAKVNLTFKAEVVECTH